MPSTRAAPWISTGSMQRAQSGSGVMWLKAVCFINKAAGNIAGIIWCEGDPHVFDALDAKHHYNFVIQGTQGNTWQLVFYSVKRVIHHAASLSGISCIGSKPTASASLGIAASK